MIIFFIVCINGFKCDNGRYFISWVIYKMYIVLFKSIKYYIKEEEIDKNL